jgi:hypothetical protein
MIARWVYYLIRTCTSCKLHAVSKKTHTFEEYTVSTLDGQFQIESQIVSFCYGNIYYADLTS